MFCTIEENVQTKHFLQSTNVLLKICTHIPYIFILQKKKQLLLWLCIFNFSFSKILFNDYKVAVMMGQEVTFRGQFY